MSGGKTDAGVNYYSGEFLTNADYADEQSAQYRRRARVAAGLNSWGIVSGLEVTALAGDVFGISPGAAFDGLGRLIRLSGTHNVAPPETGDGSDALLTIAFALTPVSTGRSVGYAQERPVLAWVPAEADPQAQSPVTQVVLARLSNGALDTSVRVYASARLGTLSLVPQSDTRSAEITGWSREARRGLVIRANELRFAPVSPAPAQLNIPDGAVSVGTMALAASLDIAPLTAGETGPGTITSHGDAIAFSDAAAQDFVQPGFILCITGAAGDTQTATVLAKLGNGDVTVSAELACKAAAWRFIRPYALRIAASSGRPALAIGKDGNAGFGAEPAETRTVVQDGGLALAGDNRSLSIAEGGAVATPAGSRIGFEPDSARMALYASDHVMLSLPDLPWTSVLDDAGNLGIGTDTPQARLDVNGYIQSTQGGFVFPDGSTQTSAEISVPVGAVIDWWRGNSAVEIPSNYRICNGDMIEGTGTAADGKQTPNLLNQFIVGVTDPDRIGEVSGAPAHDHTFTTPTHTHAFPHTHPDLANRTTGEANDSDGMSGAANPNARKHHTHPFSAPVATQSASNTGSNSTAGTPATTATASPLPPYVGLIKLVRVS